MTRVVILDGSAVFRAGLRALLGTEPGMRVVGETGDTREVAELVAATRPDVVLIGVEHDDTEAEFTLARILRTAPGTYVVVLGHDDEVILRKLLARGARAYLSKNVSLSQLSAVLSIVTANGAGFACTSSSPAREPREVTAHDLLSPREIEVLELVAQAMSNVQIARTLCITEGTVKRHLRNVFEKLRAVSRLDAVNKAVAASLVSPAVPSRQLSS